MSGREKPKASKGWRKKNRLSPSQGVIKSMSQVSHLDGLSEKHSIDVADARRLREPEEVKADLAEEAKLESYYMGTGPRRDLITNILFGDCGAGYLAPDGHDGSPVVMPGEVWQDIIHRADTSRREWRDAGGKKRRCKADSEMSGQLRKIFARLPPWLADPALKEMSHDQVVDAVYQSAREFQDETGRRVLAANIHIESNHDIHIHFTYTSLVPSESSEKKYSFDYLAKILTKQRGVVRASLLKVEGVKPTLKEVKAELEKWWESGKLENPQGNKAFYQRLKRPETARRHLKSMGQAYCSKTALWEADGRSERVAKVREEKDHTFTFDSVVIQGAKWAKNVEKREQKTTGPETFYLDYWLAKRWTHAIEMRLTPESRLRAKESASDYVERYLKDGSSLPNPALDAVRKKVADENAIREADLKMREELLVTNELALKADGDALAKKNADLDIRVCNHEESKKDIEAARAALRKIPLADLCAKLGFKSTGDDAPELEIALEHGPLNHRVLFTDQSFRIEFYSLGSEEWKSLDTKTKGTSGAIDFMMSIPQAVGKDGKRVDNLTLSQACEKLVSLFPDLVGGITLEALKYKSRQIRKNEIANAAAPELPIGQRKEPGR